MSEAKRRQSRRGVSLVANAISDLLGRGPVVAQAIGFYDQPEVGPVEVDLEAIDALLRQRQRQSDPADDGEEAPFELRVSEAERVPIEKYPQHPDTGLPLALIQVAPETLWIDEVEPVGPVDSPLEVSMGSPSPRRRGEERMPHS